MPLNRRKNAIFGPKEPNVQPEEQPTKSEQEEEETVYSTGSSGMKKEQGREEFDFMSEGGALKATWLWIPGVSGSLPEMSWVEPMCVWPTAIQEDYNLLTDTGNWPVLKQVLSYAAADKRGTGHLCVSEVRQRLAAEHSASVMWCKTEACEDDWASQLSSNGSTSGALQFSAAPGTARFGWAVLEGMMQAMEGVTDLALITWLHARHPVIVVQRDTFCVVINLEDVSKAIGNSDVWDYGIGEGDGDSSKPMLLVAVCSAWEAFNSPSSAAAGMGLMQLVCAEGFMSTDKLLSVALLHANILAQLTRPSKEDAEHVAWAVLVGSNPAILGSMDPDSTKDGWCWQPKRSCLVSGTALLTNLVYGLSSAFIPKTEVSQTIAGSREVGISTYWLELAAAKEMVIDSEVAESDWNSAVARLARMLCQQLLAMNREATYRKRTRLSVWLRRFKRAPTTHVLENKKKDLKAIETATTADIEKRSLSAVATDWESDKIREVYEDDVALELLDMLCVGMRNAANRLRELKHRSFAINDVLVEAAVCDEIEALARRVRARVVDIDYLQLINSCQAYMRLLGDAVFSEKLVGTTSGQEANALNGGILAVYGAAENMHECEAGITYYRGGIASGVLIKRGNFGMGHAIGRFVYLGEPAALADKFLISKLGIDTLRVGADAVEQETP